jgi:hypothetical protein
MITNDQPKRSPIECPKVYPAYNNFEKIQIAVIPFYCVIDIKIVKKLTSIPPKKIGGWST